MELTEVEAQQLSVALKKTMERIKVVLNPGSFNVGWNDGPIAGQTIPHLHVLIFPRYEGDGGGSVHSMIKNPSTVPVSEVAEKFSK